VPFQAFPSQDGHVVVAAGTEKQWERLCDVIGRRDLAEDARFVDNLSRCENIPALVEELSAVFRMDSTATWVQVLSARDIPCAPIQDIAQAAADPQVVAREMIVEVDDPLAGKQRVVNTPLRFSETPAAVTRSSPQLGEHTETIIEEWLGHN